MGHSKRCSLCGEVKELDEFHAQAKSKDGRQSACKPCARNRAREWFHANRDATNERTRARHAAEYAADPEKFREKSRKWRAENPDRIRVHARRTTLKRYGLTPEAFDAMLTAQGGRCAVCRTDEPGGAGTWHVDHNHACCPTPVRSCGGCVRALLCSRCNTALGFVDDDPGRLMALADYLLRHGAVIANL